MSITVDEFTPVHCRAARAWLALSQPALARECGIGEREIGYLEKDDTRYALPHYQVYQTLVRKGFTFYPKGLIGPIIDKRTRTIDMSGRYIISSQQCRAARAWLGWTQKELAEIAGIPAITYIFFYEKDRPARYGKRTVDISLVPVQMRDAFEKYKITFLFDQDNKPNGIRVRS